MSEESSDIFDHGTLTPKKTSHDGHYGSILGMKVRPTKDPRALPIFHNSHAVQNTAATRKRSSLNHSRSRGLGSGARSKYSRSKSWKKSADRESEIWLARIRSSEVDKKRRKGQIVFSRTIAKFLMVTWKDIVSAFECVS